MFHNPQRILLSLIFAAACTCTPLLAQQIDIAGPPGSAHFGKQIAVLPNGNIVITDPDGVVAGVGAAYLYSPAGNRISQLSGSSAGDNVGGGGIVVLTDGNFLVLSPNWHNAGTANAGAITWVNANVGLNGVVSPGNSLVGNTQGDSVGYNVGTLAIGRLPGGGYVVPTPDWNGNVVGNHVGAVTVCAPNGSTVGPVSLSNSLIGVNTADHVGSGGVVLLTNGNYVFASPQWSGGNNGDKRGAVTWGSGASALHGIVSPTNSLVGSSVSDQIGYAGVTALSNGNYVVASPTWSNGSATTAGAATWGNGNSGVVGPASAANSLVGTTTNDLVGQGVIALSNGNYVVSAPRWNNGVAGNHFGAVTWGNGADGSTVGAVTTANSLFGTTVEDTIGSLYTFSVTITALSNGNFVIASPLWNNGGADAHFGAVTWVNGSAPSSGPVSAANSLIGTSTDDQIGGSGVTALSNGNYVVGSAGWKNGTTGSIGAATWGDGSTGTVGVVSAGNSIIGAIGGDFVGSTVVALTNGNFVVVSSQWNNGVSAAGFGAVTWSRGDSGALTGPVSVANSLVGTTTGDGIGAFSVRSLDDGNYVICSPFWNNGSAGEAWGAMTWGNGDAGTLGSVSAKNSLVGSHANATLCYSDVFLLPGSHYATVAGNQAVALGDGHFGLVGSAQPWNSVIGNFSSFNVSMGYDSARGHFVVGRPDDNKVSVFVSDQLFAGRFE